MMRALLVAVAWADIILCDMARALVCLSVFISPALAALVAVAMARRRRRR